MLLIQFSIHKKSHISFVKVPFYQPEQVILILSTTDLLTVHRRSFPIKIWPTYAVPPTITLYPRSTYDLRERGHPRPFFNRLKTLSRSPRPLRAGPTNLRCIPDQHTPDQGPLIADPSIFPRQRGFSGVKCALNVFYGLLSRISWLLRIWLQNMSNVMTVVAMVWVHLYFTLQYLQRQDELQPLCGAIQPIEVAKSIAFLASDESSCITGETLFIDGGRHVRAPV